MGKIELGQRMGNTIATPFRRGGEVGNATVNILRQGHSSVKNIAEVSKQTIDALIDNFTNFSKVDGKRYQRVAKGTTNLVSAVTRRPLMIVGAGIAGGVNQGIRQPFKKLLYTPGKMFKGMRNATRIFSKKKGFDFVKYDTHETEGDTWVNKIKEKRSGFLGEAPSSKEEEKVVKEKKTPEAKKEEKKEEKNGGKSKNTKEEKTETQSESKSVDIPKEGKTIEKKSLNNPHAESESFEKAIKNKDDAFIDKELKERGYSLGGTLGKQKIGTTPSSEKPKSIDEIKKKYSEETQAKITADIEAKKRKNISKEDKEKHKKEFATLLENNFTEEGVLARAKKHKKGDNLDQILRTLDKENVTFATFIDDEILAKKA